MKTSIKSNPKLDYINYQKWVFNTDNAWQNVNFDDLSSIERGRLLCKWERDYFKEERERIKRWY